MPRASLDRGLLSRIPQHTVECVGRRGPTKQGEGDDDPLDRLDRDRTNFDLLRRAVLESLARVDLLRKGAAINEHTRTTKNVRYEIVREERQLREVLEAAESTLTEGTIQIRHRDLCALVEGHLQFSVPRLVTIERHLQ